MSYTVTCGCILYENIYYPDVFLFFMITSIFLISHLDLGSRYCFSLLLYACFPSKTLSQLIVIFSLQKILLYLPKQL